MNCWNCRYIGSVKVSWIIKVFSWFMINCRVSRYSTIFQGASLPCCRYTPHYPVVNDKAIGILKYQLKTGVRNRKFTKLKIGL